jgi:N-6 DNA Methylase
VRSYQPYVDSLRRLSRDTRIAKADPNLITEALDGDAALRLRELVPLARRRAMGTFFTPSSLAKVALVGMLDSIGPESVVLDPACGAGDLLLPVLRHILAGPIGNTPGWVHQIRGIDTQPLFVEATRLRLSILSRNAGAPRPPGQVAGVVTGNCLSESATIAEASHIVLNPPYRTIPARNLDWAEGTVNSAAVFLMHCLTAAKPGARLMAILPDVLRTGSRYARWRHRIEKLASVDRIAIHGRFDHWTDVDVFSLQLRRRTRISGRPSEAGWYTAQSGPKVGDHFSVHVGSVVNNREPHRGKWVPYLTATSAPAWETVDAVRGRRRYSGELIKPPFLVIRRTSSPSDSHRAIATLVADGPSVAVDNHLLILTPRLSGSIDLASLLKLMHQSSTTDWLNRRIRCRHLTVGAIAGIPLPHRRAD